ncbi:MAG: hypothetical protein ABI946_08220 [Chthoniobacterales bacterium]
MKNSPLNDLPPSGWLREFFVLDDCDPHPAPVNMAIDEVLLQTATSPILRFYRWQRPSLSFGYFGRLAEVAAESSKRDLVRRWTGGGIVPHGADLTYSFILPRAAGRAIPTPQQIYRQIHGAIQQALSENLPVALANADAPKVSDVCFANAVASDVLVQGRKIAGAAQRRTRAGLLHQGSIQYEGLPDGFREAFTRALGLEFSQLTLDSGVLRSAEKLAEQKYGNPKWLEMR